MRIEVGPVTPEGLQHRLTGGEPARTGRAFRLIGSSYLLSVDVDQLGLQLVLGQSG
jgi:hypothetical protein